MDMKPDNSSDSSTMTGEENWVSVCRLDDLIENMGQCALVGNKQVALFRLSGVDQVYAVDNLDPFSKANVLSRGIVGDLKGATVVASPIYKQHFNLATGQCLEDESVRLSVYATRIVDNAVQVSVDSLNSSSNLKNKD